MVSKKKLAVWNSCYECGVETDWSLPSTSKKRGYTLKEWNEIVGNYLVYQLSVDGVVYESSDEEDCCLCDKHSDWAEEHNEIFEEENSSLRYVEVT